MSIKQFVVSGRRLRDLADKMVTQDALESALPTPLNQRMQELK
jgi:hypothetical protein